MRIQNWSSRALFSAGFLLLSSSLAQASPPNHEFFQCNEPSGILCAEQRNNPGGNEYYVGHDEPSLLFYSNKPGAGFGIRSREQVERLAGHVDGVVVGSALVEVLERGEDPGAFLRALRAR